MRSMLPSMTHQSPAMKKAPPSGIPTADNDEILPQDWERLEEGECGDAIVAAMVAGGVDHLFFTSGSEICFYQEAIAKAIANGKPAPRLITMTHEHAGLNAALGYAMVSGRPAATAVHVDAGTLHQGGALHSAMHANLPILLTAGLPPTSYSGTSAAARNAGGHLWLQETYDQHGIVRQYVKWDKSLKSHDNPGLVVSRALQVATSEPKGPVYLSIAPEIGMAPLASRRFPTTEQLGVAAMPAMPEASARAIAERLIHAHNPRVVVSSSGRHPETVPALVRLCELLGVAAVHAASKRYLSFPMAHDLMQPGSSLGEADVVLVLEADVPWVPGPAAPPPAAWVAVVGLDPVQVKFPTYEFTADLRVTSGSLEAISAIEQAALTLMSPQDLESCRTRGERFASEHRERRAAIEREVLAGAARRPIDPQWACLQIGKAAGERAIVIDDSLPYHGLVEFLKCAEPSTYFATPGTSGGWAPGAAFGAKLAAPARDVIAVTGDGFYMFGTPTAAIWAAKHYGAPFLTVIFQNRSYSTATRRMANMYPNGYAQRSGFDGGYFDPPMDFAKEAEAAGAYGENVREPEALEAALQRGLAETRAGRPAVIAIWMARLLQSN